MAAIDHLEGFTWEHPYFMSLTPTGKLAFVYVLDRILAHRDYISTIKMAHDTGIAEHLCDTYIRQFAVDRELPHMKVLEEQIG